jgi:hypothetical protein
MEPNQTSPRKDVDYTELSRIDGIFRENREEILNDLAAVLAKYDIGGYNVSAVTFAPPNPKLCVPYVRYDRTYGVVCGVSCFDV